jgi:hypothetical protein
MYHLPGFQPFGTPLAHYFSYQRTFDWTRLLNKTLFLLGQSDDESRGASTSVRVEGGSVVTKELVGVTPILPYINTDSTLAAHCASILIDNSKNKLPPNPHINLFNLVGDADSSMNSLHRIQTVINSVQPRRCFNRPVDVFKTSRASLPKTLANIPGCLVPRSESADPKSFSELQAACGKFNSWPMIVRARGYHGGECMQLLTDESQLESLRDLSWPYNGINLIQYVDCRNEEGLHHKIRVMMVNGVAYARQCVYSDKWSIHAGSRADLMEHDIELCQQEERFLAQMRDKGLQQRNQLFREIYKRIGLDVFGIDFALVNGELVIFEANACMHFLGTGDIRSGKYSYLGSYKQALRTALKNMLLRDR